VTVPTCRPRRASAFDTVVGMASETYQAKYKRASEIRLGGAIGNLQEGIELETHGVTTRLIAWPGNGFQTEAVHVLTVHAGQESTAYSYDVSEEAMLCLAGEGEVYLHGSWRAFRPGDLAYFPEGVSHAVRNLRGTDDVIVVTQITPPQLDLYETARGRSSTSISATILKHSDFPAGTYSGHRVELDKPDSTMCSLLRTRQTLSTRIRSQTNVSSCGKACARASWRLGIPRGTGWILTPTTSCSHPVVFSMGTGAFTPRA
jgi:mannose-6-phosphate isomerase-like protein (cupin superfamily)